MRYGITTGIAAITLFVLYAGCSREKSDSYSIDEGAIKNTGSSSSSIGSSAARQIGIGDVESNIRLYVSLDKSSYSDTIINQEEFTKLEFLARASVDVSQPYPSTLNMNIFSQNIKNYPGHTYRATINLYADDKIIGTYKFITGRNALRDIKQQIVDVMPLIDPEPGKSILMHVRAEIEFFPNTEEESITVDSPAPATVTRATKMGNPLRITFTP